ncbi:MAG: hypothetical protein ABIK20_02060 [Candidatus Omnitrophota bacterium]|nr:hypothetical protein [Candidatus Omnitrophota bacterium]
MTKRTYRNASVAALVLLFLLLSPLQDKIDLQRKQMGFEQRLLLMPGQIAGSLALGGFKGLAADLLWLQVEELFHSGQSHKMLPILRSVTFLQPKFITPWAVGGWHLSYNISVMAKDPNEKEAWIQAGVDFLKEGITYNPERYDLYFELGWTFYHKVKNYAEAVKYLELACKFPGPDYLPNVLAHAYEKNGQIDTAIETWREILRSGNSFGHLSPRHIHNLKTYGSTITPETPKKK